MDEKDKILDINTEENNHNTTEEEFLIPHNKELKRYCGNRFSKTEVIKLTVIGILAAIALGLIISAFIPNSPVKRLIMESFDWAKKIRPIYSMMFFCSIYFIAMMIMFSSTPFHLGAGVLYGLIYGSIVSTIASVSSALLAFILGRTLLRGWAERVIATNPKLKAIDGAVSDSGFLIVFLCRLSPVIPLGISNYAFGATKITFTKYTLSTIAGMVPINIIYAYMGSLLTSIAEIFTKKTSPSEWIVVSVGLVLTIVGVVVITVITKKAIDKAIEKSRINQAQTIEEESNQNLLESIRQEEHHGNRKLPN